MPAISRLLQRSAILGVFLLCLPGWVHAEKTGAARGLTNRLSDAKVKALLSNAGAREKRAIHLTALQERLTIRPNAGTCSITQTSCNAEVSGTLGPPDCTLDEDGTHLDFWQFQGTPQDRVTIIMRSLAVDSYLFLLNPNAEVVTADDDSGGGVDARIVFNLNAAGTWTIAANSAVPGTGAYTLAIGCTEAVECSLSDIACNTTVSGSLSVADCTADDGTFLDLWQFQGGANQTVTATLRSSAFDAYLILVDPLGEIVRFDDDSGGGSDARIAHTLPIAGTWYLVANSFEPQTGAYTLQLSCGEIPPPPPPPACVPSNTKFCVHERFEVSLFARDQRTDKTDTGHVMLNTPVYGMFGFPVIAGNITDPQIFVKVLDGRPVNGRWWVFISTLTDVDVMVTVRDTVTGLSRQFHKPAGSALSIFDTTAF